MGSWALAQAGSSSAQTLPSVADLDADGDGEVLVGAPGMTTRDERGAGAVLVYNVEARGDSALTEAPFMASAEANDALGASLTTAKVGERDIVVAGAARNGKVALFYCSKLVPGNLRGERCK